MANEPNQIFLPWVQPGVAAAIPDQAREQLKLDQPAVLLLPLRLVVNSNAVDKTARLYGPGDITAIDVQQVVRLEPKHGTTNFEPNYFAAIEFDRPDFPWLFTPLKSNDQGQLRPWLCLVVVRKQTGVELRQGPNQSLPVLEIKSPARPFAELPDLSESHLWVHAQVSGATRNDLATVLVSQPAKSVSRLLCPRRLDPATDYLACVVPSFEVGRAAGLNEPATANTLRPAWPNRSETSTEPEPDSIKLPVYFSWEFRTSAGGDFEDLVRRLQPRELPAEVGRRPLDVGQPGFKVDFPANVTEDDTTVDLEGALRVLKRPSKQWPDNVRQPFQQALGSILNAPWEIATSNAGDQDPVVGPPIYGSWQAAKHVVTDPANSATPWLDELNLDPRHRVVAAVGTQVVQDQQEQLMAAAWEQLGDIEQINQRLRQAQLSRSVNQKYHGKAFTNFSPESFLSIVAPAQSRLEIAAQGPNQPRMLLAQKLQRAAIPRSAVSAQVRKLSRPRGAINKQFSRAGVAGVANVQGMFRVFNANVTLMLHALTPPVSRGPVTIDQISDAFLNVNPPLPAFQKDLVDKFHFRNLGAETIRTTPPTINADQEFVTAAAAHHEYLARLCPQLTASLFADTIVAKDLKATILTTLDPAHTVRDTVTAGARLKPPNPLTGDELDPIMDAPEFPQPMYEALRDRSQDFLFPGLEFVPAETVQLLQTNARFIESFMVGLNAEMGRELLWRNYPTDQRGTYFQQFWDTAAAGAQARTDIPPIHRWRDHKLGTIASAAGDDKLVLLIRGELLRRYPGTVIYAVKAMRLNGKRVPAIDHPQEAAAQLVQPPLDAYPIFRGSVEPDVTFVGFDLTEADVETGDGWFFVLQQQPTEPRFGLDEFRLGSDGNPPPLRTWNDLNWSHLASNQEELNESVYVRVGKFQLTANDSGKWGQNSAHMAYITKQLPARIAIHSSELIKK